MIASLPYVAVFFLCVMVLILVCQTKIFKDNSFGLWLQWKNQHFFVKTFIVVFIAYMTVFAAVKPPAVPEGLENTPQVLEVLLNYSAPVAKSLEDNKTPEMLSNPFERNSDGGSFISRIVTNTALPWLLKPDNAIVYSGWTNYGVAEDTFWVNATNPASSWGFVYAEELVEGAHVSSSGTLSFNIPKGSPTPHEIPDGTGIDFLAPFHSTLSVIPPDGRFWYYVTDSNSVRFTWQNFNVGRDTNNAISFQCELFNNGDYTFRYAFPPNFLSFTNDFVIGAQFGGEGETYIINNYSNLANGVDIIWDLPDSTLDTDGDGTYDIVELYYGFDPKDPTTPEDWDNDGLSNNFEYYYTNAVPTNGIERLNARLFDSDGDKLPDIFEVMYDSAFNPLVAYSTTNECLTGNPDNDGLNNAREMFYGTNPFLADTDGDNASDDDEVYINETDPLNSTNNLAGITKIHIEAGTSDATDYMLMLTGNNRTNIILTADSNRWYYPNGFAKTNELLTVKVSKNTLEDDNYLCNFTELEYAIKPADAWVIPCYIPKEQNPGDITNSLPSNILFAYPSVTFNAEFESTDGGSHILPCGSGVTVGLVGYVTLGTNNINMQKGITIGKVKPEIEQFSFTVYDNETNQITSGSVSFGDDGGNVFLPETYSNDISTPERSTIGTVTTGIEQFSFNLYDNKDNKIILENMTLGDDGENIFLPQTYSNTICDLDFVYDDAIENIYVSMEHSDFGTETTSVTSPDISPSPHARSISVYGTLLNMTNGNSGLIDISLEGTHCYIDTTITLSVLENAGKISTYENLPYTWNNLDGCGDSLSMEVSAGNSCSLQIGDVVVQGKFNKLYYDDTPPEDETTITVIALDLDVDSDNDNGYNTPDMDTDEEEIQQSSSIGKIVKVYREDVDNDGVPNVEDMDHGGDFVPLVIQSHPTATTAKYKFDFDNDIRIWTKDGNSSERTNEFITATTPGNLIESGCEYSYSELFTDGWSAGGQMTCQTLYIEGLTKGIQNITCEYILEDTTLYTETVKVSVIDVLLVPDYDRDGVIGTEDIFRYSTNEVFRFWINDDDDDQNSEDSGDDNPGNLFKDFESTYIMTTNDSGYISYEAHIIDGSRDMIDFFAVALQGLGDTVEILPETSYDYVLKHEDGDVNVFIDTGLTPNEAGSHLYDKDFIDDNKKAILQPLTSGETNINSYISGLTTYNKCVILVEGRGTTTSPLMLEIRKKSDSSVVYSVSMPLSLSPVENMFYHKDLIYVTGGDDSVPDRSSTTNGLPDNGKNFVFVHGYNVNEADARGWGSEFYKRLYWSGSNAKFHAVSWYGYQSQIEALALGLKTPNYHENVINALYTAPYLRTYINSLQGDVIIAGHSLGNMVVSSAIAQYNADVEKFFIINGAVAMECYNPSQSKEWGMVHYDWDGYYYGGTNDFLFASEWYTLFSNNDARHDLSWRGIFTNMNNTTIYNMHSSGEDVLGNISHDKGNYAASPSYIWGSQEKLKGRMFDATDWLIGSAVCGWGENKVDYPDWYPGPGYNPTNLITKPFFMKSYPDLFSTNSATAQTYASANNKALLAKAIPARTFAVGRNEVGDETFHDNVNMNTTEYQSGWPLSRLQSNDEDNWLHSDVKNIGYLYNYKVYNYIVENGGLK